MVEDGEDCTDYKQPELEQLIQDVLPRVFSAAKRINQLPLNWVVKSLHIIKI